MSAPSQARIAKEEAKAALLHGNHADNFREECKNDPRFFYLNVLDQRKRGLSRLHDLLFDVLRLDELDKILPQYAHSPLRKYLPPRDRHGRYKEKWIYFPSVGGKATVHNGSGGDIEKMFTEKFWRGIVIRIAGTGKDRAVLIPRGHLKTEICVVTQALWRLIRDPADRILIRCSRGQLAIERIAHIKQVFDGNETFQQYFGYLRPDHKELGAIWKQDAIKIALPEGVFAKGLREPSLMSSGISAGLAGYHFDRIILDDVVDEVNSTTDVQRGKVADRVGLMAALGDPGYSMDDIGTLWSDSDAHALRTRPGYPMYEDCSFMVATVEDAAGNFIWPEVFTPEVVQQKRKQINDDYRWFCNYYNQPVAGKAEAFDPEWINEDSYFDKPPEQVAVDKRLRIVMAIDPASSVGKKSDYTAVCVLGQDSDGTRYILDGLREKIKDGDLCGRLADIICKWVDVAVEAKGGFQAGIEAFSFQRFIGPQLRDVLLKRGRGLSVKELQPDRRAKQDRIRVLSTPFMAGRVKMPRRIFKATGESRGYNLISAFLEEFRAYPRDSVHDDFLDAMAYCEEMLTPVRMTDPAAPDRPLSPAPDIDFRDVSREPTLAETLCGSGITTDGPRPMDWDMRGGARARGRFDISRYR